LCDETESSDSSETKQACNPDLQHYSFVSVLIGMEDANELETYKLFQGETSQSRTEVWTSLNYISKLGLSKNRKESDKVYIGMFVEACLSESFNFEDSYNPMGRYSNQFQSELYYAVQNRTMAVQKIVNFMLKEGGQDLVSDHIRKNWVISNLRVDEYDHLYDDAAKIKAAFKTMNTNYAFFDALLRFNIPCPVSFLVLRMGVRIRASSVIFLKSGGTTGVVVIKDGFVAIKRRVDDHAIEIGMKFSTATFITNRLNISIIPHVKAEEYLGGAGTTLWDPTKHREQYLAGSRSIRDMFVFAVKYNWSCLDPFTDASGTMDTRVYNSAGRGMSTHSRQFCTSDIYTAMWGIQSSVAHIFTPIFTFFRGSTQTLCIQGHQHVWGGGDLINKSVPGRDQMGPMCQPWDYKTLHKNNAGLAGSGIEGIIPRERMLTIN
jgi:hypothetical protein